ncbi:MAG TPA: MBL fold metallo-hydrolase [Fimbriimonas sp.]|nr:MBL fold metallo-hydrolase [Fimbriimonas sp.]
MWEPVLPGIELLRDSCNVYRIKCPEGSVVVNPGTGAWLDDDKPRALLCTHYFRDHAAGAALASREGVAVYVPEYEEEIFADPSQHFRQRENYIVYDNLWDRFSPIIPTKVDGVLRDYDRITVAGRQFEVIPLPGVTCGQVGLKTTLDDGRSVVFSAEAIHSPGKMARIAPLQYNYNDLSGAISAYFSAARLKEASPDCLLPSLGEPIIGNTRPALDQLQKNLLALMAVRPGMTETVAAIEKGGLEQVTEHVWLDRRSMSNTWFLLSESGKVMALDYGYSLETAASFPGYPKKDRRRALLHGLEALQETLGATRIDVVLVSHFHDDHVCGIPVLQRLFGTECWVPEIFADLLEHPEAHTFPCNWPFASKVTRRLPLDRPFEWEEYTFHLAPMSGHTRFSALIGFEADGKRFAHTGDQYFFEGGVESFEQNRRSQNQVFRNGALLDGFAQSGKWMLDWRPEIVLQGHQPAMHTDAAFFRHIAEWPHDYAGLASEVMALRDDEPHFNLDSWAGWIWPYRIELTMPGAFTVRATVRNPFPEQAELQVRLVGPEGWTSEAKTLSAEGRQETTCELSMNPIGTCFRQPIGLELTANERPFGQVAEALVTIGG